MSSSRALVSAARICASSSSSSLPCSRTDSRIAVAPLLQLPQVAQPLLERAQLRVVEHLGRFLAVARDERHGRPAVEQLDRGLDLPLPYAELLGDPAFDGRRHDGFAFSVLGVPRVSLHCGRWHRSAEVQTGSASEARDTDGSGVLCDVDPGALRASLRDVVVLQLTGARPCGRPARLRRRAGPPAGREASPQWRLRRRSSGGRLRLLGTRDPVPSQAFSRPGSATGDDRSRLPLGTPVGPEPSLWGPVVRSLSPGRTGRPGRRPPSRPWRRTPLPVRSAGPRPPRRGARRERGPGGRCRPPAPCAGRALLGELALGVQQSALAQPVLAAAQSLAV